MKSIFISALLFVSMLLNLKAIEWDYVNPNIGRVSAFYKHGNDVIVANTGIKYSTDGGVTFEYTNKAYDGYWSKYTQIPTETYSYPIRDIHVSKMGVMYASDGILIFNKTKNSDTWTMRGGGDYDSQYNYFLEYDNKVYSVSAGKLYKEQSQYPNGWDYVYSHHADSYSAISSTHSIAIHSDGCFYSVEKTDDYDKTAIYVYGTKTNNESSFEVDMDIYSIFSSNDKLYAYADYPSYDESIIYSEDNGKNWSLLTNIDDLVDEIVPEGTNKLYRHIEVEIKDNIFVVHGNTYEDWQYLISYDYGETWDYFNTDIYSDGIDIYEDDIYISYDFIYKLDKETKDFVKIDWTYQGLKYYRENNDLAICKDDDSYGTTVYTKEGEEDWEKYSNPSSNVFVLSNGDVYECAVNQDNNREIRYNSETIMSDSVGMSFMLAESEDRIVLYTYDYGGFSRVLLFEKGELILEFAEDSRYHTDFNCDGTYAKLGDSTLDLHDINNKIIKSIPLSYIEEDLKSLGQIVYDKNILFVEARDASYLSTDLGETWTMVLDRIETYKYEPIFATYDNKVYYSFGNKIYRLNEDYAWEDILGEVSNAHIFNFEFDGAGNLYVYTAEGVYMSKYPLSVETQSISDASAIDIYPTPADQYIKIDTDIEIDSYTIYGMDGKRCNVILDGEKTINTSELKSGTYILNIISNDKTYTSKFIINR